MSKTLTVDTTTIKFQIWDTAGQERVSLTCIKTNEFNNFLFVSIGHFYQCIIEMQQQLLLYMTLLMR